MKLGPVILAVMLAGCEHAPTPPVSEQPPVKVQTVVVQPQSVPDIYEVVGTVRPKFGATVSPKVMATILQIPVKPGDPVKTGDVLAQLDDRELRAAFERAQGDYERAKKLLNDGVATAAEFQSAEERYRIAKAALSYTSITAPYAGIVADKLCEVGDLASPGKPLFSIEQPEDYRLEAYVPERFASAVPVGATVHVIVAAVGGECDAVVGEVIPASDPASRSFLIKVDLHRRKPLKSGMFGRAQIKIGERTGLFVPKTAVQERGQLTFVFVAHDGRAQMQLVRLGKPVGDQVEVLSGLAAGEKIVVNPGSELTDGRRLVE
jgi:RND family efflux transporter MFP subunit